MKKVKILLTTLIVFVISMLVSSSNCFAERVQIPGFDSVNIPAGSKITGATQFRFGPGGMEIMRGPLSFSDGSVTDNGRTVTRTTSRTGQPTITTVNGVVTNVVYPGQYISSTITQGEFYPPIPPAAAGLIVKISINGQKVASGYPGQIITTSQGRFRIPYTVIMDNGLPWGIYRDTNDDGIYDELEIYNYPDTP